MGAKLPKSFVHINRCFFTFKNVDKSLAGAHSGGVMGAKTPSGPVKSVDFRGFSGPKGG